MGDRRNVIVKEAPASEGTPGFGVSLYTHFRGSELPEILRAAINRGITRWNDPAYLARIIFSEMTRGAEAETTGFGINPVDEDGNAWCEASPGHDIVVDVTAQTVDGVAFTDYIRGEAYDPHGGQKHRVYEEN